MDYRTVIKNLKSSWKIIRYNNFDVSPAKLVGKTKASLTLASTFLLSKPLDFPFLPLWESAPALLKA